MRLSLPGNHRLGPMTNNRFNRTCTQQQARKPAATFRAALGTCQARRTAFPQRGTHDPTAAVDCKHLRARLVGAAQRVALAAAVHAAERARLGQLGGRQAAQRARKHLERRAVQLARQLAAALRAVSGDKGVNQNVNDA